MEILPFGQGDNVRQDKQQQECGNQCYLSPLPLCPLHIQLSAEEVPQQHKSQAKLLALCDTMFTDAGWENSPFPCLLDFWRYHLTFLRIAIGKSYFRNHYNASQALDFLMWCSVQRFPVCSAASLYFEALCKTLKISCYWLETRSLLLFPNQCVNKTNDSDKWSDTLSLDCMCASHAGKKSTVPTTLSVSVGKRSIVTLSGNDLVAWRV